MQKDINIAGVPAYHTYPEDGEKHPGLILIEEIWGVNAHIRSVADRFATAGFSVVAPELLPKGLLEALTPELHEDLFDPEKRAAAQPILREAMQPMEQPEYATTTIGTLKACVDYLLADSGVNGAVAVLGFCFGGSYSFHLAAHDDRIRAAVPLYGHEPAEDEIPKISCPILAFYGSEDAGVMTGLPKLKEDMAKNGKQFEAIVYEGAGHAFFNDTNARMYKPEFAKDAWEKALAFLQEHTAV